MKRRSFYVGRLQQAHHEISGVLAVGDRVKLRGSQNQGVIEGLTKSNFGRGRPVAEILWDSGRRSKEPLGRLKKS